MESSWRRLRRSRDIKSERDSVLGWAIRSRLRNVSFYTLEHCLHLKVFQYPTLQPLEAGRTAPHVVTVTTKSSLLE